MADFQHLAFKTFVLQVVPHFLLVARIHFLRYHLDAAMILSIVTQHQVLQHGLESQRILDSNLPIQSFFLSTYN